MLEWRPVKFIDLETNATWTGGLAELLEHLLARRSIQYRARFLLDEFGAEPVLSAPSAYNWPELAKARLYVLTGAPCHVRGSSGKMLCGAPGGPGFHHGGPLAATCFECLAAVAEGER